MRKLSQMRTIVFRHKKLLERQRNQSAMMKRRTEFFVFFFAPFSYHKKEQYLRSIRAQGWTCDVTTRATIIVVNDCIHDIPAEATIFRIGRCSYTSIVTNLTRAEACRRDNESCCCWCCYITNKTIVLFRSIPISISPALFHTSILHNFFIYSINHHRYFMTIQFPSHVGVATQCYRKIQTSKTRSIKEFLLN